MTDSKLLNQDKEKMMNSDGCQSCVVKKLIIGTITTAVLLVIAAVVGSVFYVQQWQQQQNEINAKIWRKLETMEQDISTCTCKVSFNEITKHLHLYDKYFITSTSFESTMIPTFF